jgi:hypothetical protein
MPTRDRRADPLRLNCPDRWVRCWPSARAARRHAARKRGDATARALPCRRTLTRERALAGIGAPLRSKTYRALPAFLPGVVRVVALNYPLGVQPEALSTAGRHAEEVEDRLDPVACLGRSRHLEL